MNRHLVLGSPIDELLDRLYAADASQRESLASYFAARAAQGSLDWNRFDDGANQFLRDKLVALDREKAEFCYHVCRALRAVRDNPRHDADGVVIATEYEPEKAEVARANFTEAGLSHLIELREGDLRETLVDVGGSVDFMLVDIWTPMARPALALVAPYLREGAVVICDNTTRFREAYRDYFEFVNDPQNGLRTMTLPFEGGLEFTVRAH